MKKLIGISLALVLAISLMLVPAVVSATDYNSSLILQNKNPETWVIIDSDGIGGTLGYNSSGPTFDYSLTGVSGLENDTTYALIYYADKDGEHDGEQLE